MLSRAEHDPVVSPTGARKRARLVVLRITVSIRAPILEKSRVACWAAASGIAAILIGPEDRAWVVASTGSPQLARALAIDIGGASDPPCASVGGLAELHRDVEPIHKGNVKEVQSGKLVQRIFGQGVWRLAIGCAAEDAAAIPGLAPPSSRPVELAACSGPDTGLFGSGVHVDGPELAPVKPPATTGGDGRGPDGVRPRRCRGSCFWW